MRFLKLFLAAAPLLLATLPVDAASPSPLCDPAQVEALHADRDYVLRDPTMLAHAGSGQLALSRMARDQQSAQRLSSHSTLMLFERLAAHDPDSYTALTNRVLFASPVSQAREARHNLVYVAIADAEPPSSPMAVAPRLRTLFADPPPDTHALMRAVCEALPPRIMLERVRVQHGAAGSSWQIALIDQESGEQVGVLVAWLDATQTEQAVHQTWIEWGGIALLFLVMVIMVATMWRRRAKRALPAWREDAGLVHMCAMCTRRAAAPRQECEICKGLHDAHDPVRVAHELVARARREVLAMLLELDDLARADQGLFSGLFGTHQRVARHTTLHDTQTKRVAELSEAILSHCFAPPHDLWEMLGRRKVHRESSFLSRLEHMLGAEPPEFARARAPEPWMSHLSELYTLLDVVALELELRQRPAASLIILASPS